MAETIKVDIWSDIACPWCYIGKRRFEEALAGFAASDASVPVEVEYHSFELAPDTPTDFEGTEVDFLAGHKGMSAERVTQMLDHVTGVASSVGLSYDFDALQHTKTLKAHELLHFAKSQGRQRELKERLLRAYFEEGRHVGRIDDLVALAADVGLDTEAARAALEGGEFADDVQADIDQARGYGINGVPFFVFNSAYGVSGAQESAAFRGVLEQISTGQVGEQD
ncbi:protein disulfide isomerase FrnE [Klugiella xanthotipulae]|uniref:Putative DsbA family dithiol-disulfide isomerase n=1 Tax=Klugiella xanthotipulae TaxID=244735 RepID=A0A543HXY6_9MICO|nr:DsbA family oxidoreductase [Klugiella xanthotipulae]TQM63206.1 putative DsbA family dithiol-disulfide isomerase [Klugiella xanthotipulae]